MPYPTPSINEIIDRNIQKNAEARLERKRESFYVTDLNKCPRGIYYNRQGEKPSEPISLQVLGKFGVGFMYEDYFKRMAEAENVELIEEQGSVQWPEYDVRGRFDFFFAINNKPLLYEIKTLVSKGWGYDFWSRMKDPNGFYANPEHLLQLNTYVGLLKNDYPDLEGRLVYISKDCFTRHEISLPFSQELWDEAERQFSILYNCWQKQELPPRAEPIIQERGKYKVNFQAKFCEYHDLCMEDKDWEAKAIKEVRQLNIKGRNKKETNDSSLSAEDLRPQ